MGDGVQTVNCNSLDREELLVFCDFSSDHWVRLRTTNRI